MKGHRMGKRPVICVQFTSQVMTTRAQAEAALIAIC